MPRAAAQGGDLTGADRLALMRVLGIAQGARHHPMLTGHAPNATRACGRGRRRRAAASPPVLADPTPACAAGVTTVCRSAARGLGRRSVPGRPALVAESRVDMLEQLAAEAAQRP